MKVRPFSVVSLIASLALLLSPVGGVSSTVAEWQPASVQAPASAPGRAHATAALQSAPVMFPAGQGITPADAENVEFVGHIGGATAAPTLQGANGDWHIETVDSGGYPGVDTSALALDGAGDPHVAYSGGSDGGLKYARWDSDTGVWQIESLDSDGSASLVLDEAGNPHIGYAWVDNWDYDLRYAHWDADVSTWRIETVDSAGSAGMFPDVALDPAGNPHFSYFEWGNNDLKYARWNVSTGTWQTEIVDSAGVVGMWTSVAVDGSGNPHIAYYDQDNHDPKYAHWNGSTWQIERVADEGWVLAISLALDGAGIPHISYLDSVNNELKYARRDAGTGVWQIETVSSAYDVGGTSLALDGAGNPHISYMLWLPAGSSWGVQYAHRDADTGTWQIETVDSGGISSLALDDAGNPHIVYSGDDSLKHAWKEEGIYSISGYVRDSSGDPISGVVISAEAGGSATTDANGAYTIGGLTAGTYTLTPSKSGWTFTPVTRTVSVPPDATGRDFTGWRPPVVLVHGWQGMPGSDTRRCSEGVKLLAPGVAHTFGEMAQWFVDTGYDVWIANLDTGPLYTPPIEENAQCLKDQIASVRQQTGQKVTLVAHSMGGLVSRACLNLNDCRDNVVALYTLGSPNAGINSAFLLRLLAHFKVPVAEELICVWQPALCQFSTDGMLWFNLFNPNRNGVAYDFIGGTRTPFPLGWILRLFDGPNDGLVGSYSAIGWLYPTKLSVVLGPPASRYWTNETHSGGVGHPSYFEASGGPESQAFRCIAWGDCTEATSLALSAAQTEPILSATTVDVVGHLISGQNMSHALQVDTSDHSLFYLSWLTGTLSFTLTQPNGQVITPAYADAHPDVVTYTTGLGDYATPPFAAYAFTTTVPGLYIVTIGTDDVGSEGTDYLAFVALETTRTFSVATSADLYQAGQTAIFTGTLQGPSDGITGAAVQAILIRSDGITETLPFNDLGSGVYTATWTVSDAPGYLQATFTAVGDDSGTAFTRQVDELMAIAPHAAQLAGSYADRPEDEDGDGFDDTLALDVGVTATRVGTYTLSADLVAAGQTVAHVTHYAVLASGTQTVTLRFDGWDIRRSRVDGPYTVTHVYLVDLEVGGLPAEIADDVWVTAAYEWQDFGFESLYLPVVLRIY